MVESNIAALKPLEPLEIERSAVKKESTYGLLIALCLLGLWAASLGILLSLNVAKLPNWLIPLAILWQAFLYTGLFITAHDAMHGSIYPLSPKINHFIGSCAALSYGLFSYKDLLRKHWLHHRYPASDRDPDFHDQEHKSFLRWYLYFMVRYWSWKRLLGLSICFHSMQFFLHVPSFNLVCFWIIPSILSSVQLFYFGTFLPHKEPEEGYQNPHRAQTNSFSPLWSFITCYHFGYHEEHHEYPHVPWWQLPAVHKSLSVE